MQNIIYAVPIFKVGKWHDINFKVKDLDEIALNTNALIKSKLLIPVVKLGHDESQTLLQKDGYPAAGYIGNVYRIGDNLYADFIDVPDKIVTLIKGRRYQNLSAEIYLDFVHPVTGENIGYVLRGVALLGADIPEVKGLGDIMAIYNTEKYEVIQFSEKNLKEAYQMKKNWTLKEITEYLPCCVEDVKKFLELNKTNEIGGDDLAKIISEKTQKNFSDNEKKDNKEDDWTNTNEKLKNLLKNKYQFDLQEGWDKESYKSAFEKLGGTFESCVNNLTSEIDNPEAYCKWLMVQADVKCEETEKNTQETDDSIKINKEEQIEKQETEKMSETINKKQEQETKTETKTETEAEKEKVLMAEKIKELQTKIEQFKKEKYLNKIDELVKNNSNILLPKFTEHIKFFAEMFFNENKVIKFGDKETRLSDMFFEFLQKIVESKPVIFGEIAKENNEKIEISQNEIEKYKEKIGNNVQNVELALYADKISLQKNISYRDALKIAKKELERKK